MACLHDRSHQQTLSDDADLSGEQGHLRFLEEKASTPPRRRAAGQRTAFKAFLISMPSLPLVAVK